MNIKIGVLLFYGRQSCWYLVGIRIQYKLSQVELAKKLGTTHAVISRGENGSVNIGIDFLKKVANTFNKKLEIQVA